MKAAALVLITALLPLPLFAASFSCKQATAPDEKAICANRVLNDKDVEMTTKFRFLTGLFAMGTRGNMQDQQRQWLANRQRCGSDVSCLKASYDRRIAELDKVYNAIDRPL
ncbi:hypothetical protein PMPD1_1859 [Paramixta manurensis]|uniref:DUF1311 domain-containing protein n=1 Tax=Paramixta manurensis TaxID=2740817 RepID=A0A6M8UAS2_9GAMM|nr:hypothetical protein PMPD1_1859 [Erwiniaceae bacterium PD-1]